MENFKKKKYQKPHELLNFNILGTFLFTCNENIFNNVIFLPFFIQQQLNKTLFLHFFCFKLYGKTLFSFCSYFSHQKHKEDQAKKKEEEKFYFLFCETEIITDFFSFLYFFTRLSYYFAYSLLKANNHNFSLVIFVFFSFTLV